MRRRFKYTPHTSRAGYVISNKCSYVHSGIACLKKVARTSDLEVENASRCAYHVISSTIEPLFSCESFNTECPICLEKIGLDSAIEHKNVCGHVCHIKCMAGMTKLECPICRAVMINIPTTISATIDQNMAQERRSFESINFSALLNVMRSMARGSTVDDNEEINEEDDLEVIPIPSDESDSEHVVEDSVSRSGSLNNLGNRPIINGTIQEMIMHLLPSITQMVSNIENSNRR
jgi:hypothetical protein